jgi:hypothetical protein
MACGSAKHESIRIRVRSFFGRNAARAYAAFNIPLPPYPFVGEAGERLKLGIPGKLPDHSNKVYHNRDALGIFGFYY